MRYGPEARRCHTVSKSLQCARMFCTRGAEAGGVRHENDARGPPLPMVVTGLRANMGETPIQAGNGPVYAPVPSPMQAVTRPMFVACIPLSLICPGRS
jgi:hypothetical protein